jgi:hypothetical protein
VTLLIKDANTTVQSLSTQLDNANNLVAVHAPAAIVAGVATPVSAATPLPVISTAGAPAVDGSGTITLGGTAQTLFGGVVPVNGYLVANNGSSTIYTCDTGVASAGGASIPIAGGTVFMTPTGYKPPGPVSLFGSTTGAGFAARRW